MIIASQDPDIIGLADRYIFLDEGRLIVNDTGPSGAKKIHALLGKNNGD
ncbi:hypothetical protein [Sulfitobacter sp. SK012]|nr:hypothetical protein [Sulfitobacter sp. SK012]